MQLCASAALIWFTVLVFNINLKIHCFNRWEQSKKYIRNRKKMWGWPDANWTSSCWCYSSLGHALKGKDSTVWCLKIICSLFKAKRSFQCQAVQCDQTSIISGQQQVPDLALHFASAYFVKLHIGLQSKGRVVIMGISPHNRISDNLQIAGNQKASAEQHCWCTCIYTCISDLFLEVNFTVLKAFINPPLLLLQ